MDRKEMSGGNSESNDRECAEASVPDVLMTVANEVRSLSLSASDLQDLVGNLVVAGAFGGSQSIYELQNLDRLCQSLGALADFLKGVADSASAEWKVDIRSASEEVKLADMCSRLTGRKPLSSDADAAGDFEEFESWPLTG